MRFIVVFSILLCALFNSLTAQRTVLIKDVTIVDVENLRLIKNQDVLIKDSLIAQIVKTGKTLTADTIVNGTGRFLIPGLWDMHTHIWSDVTNFPLLIANGVTGVRGMFDGMSNVRNWRKKMQSGAITGPLFFAAGPIVDGPNPVWQGSVAVKNEEDGRKAVDSLKNKLGVDFIKVYSLLSRASYFAIADECKKQNISFAGHVPNEVTVLEAAEAGQKSIEHLYGFIEMGSDSLNYWMDYQLRKIKDSNFSKRSDRKEFLFRTYNETKLKEGLLRLKAAGTWICPTLTVNHGIAYVNDTTLLDDPRMVYMGKFMRDFWDYRKDFRFKSWTPLDFQQSRQEFEMKLKITNLIHKAAIPIIAGTDFPNPHCYIGFGIHDELEWLVNAGLSPGESLKTATLNPAKYFNITKTHGTVAVGKYASLVLLAKNPLENISNTKSIEMVFVNGKAFSSAQLQEMLERVKKMVAFSGGTNSTVGFHVEEDNEFGIHR